MSSFGILNLSGVCTSAIINDVQVQISSMSYKQVPIMRTFLLVMLAIILSAGSAYAALTLPLSDEANGSDGDLSVAQYETRTIDLSKAVTGSWDQVGDGNGVYDPEKWAVVFKYNSVNIKGGGAVYFKNHPSAAPVVWIVKGSVVTNSPIYINGGGYSSGALSVPGPGGFRGGIGTYSNANGVLGSAGFGPGGSSLGTSTSSYGSGGSYATSGSGVPTIGPTYGNHGVFPLIGGSGGSGSRYNYQGGGAGGGAISIVAADTVTLNAGIYANGGSTQYATGGAGSGGAIRLVADKITGGALLQAVAGTPGIAAGNGRIRIEANDASGFTCQSEPQASVDVAGITPKIWPDDTMPYINVVSLGGTMIAPTTINGKTIADPHASMSYTDSDLVFDTAGTRELILHGENIPVDGTWKVSVRVIPLNGNDVSVEATFDSGDLSSSTWKANIDISKGLTAVQARAYKVN